MSKKIARESQQAIDWLGNQPGVTSVILGGRATSTRHRHKPGFTKVLMAGEKGVLVRSYSQHVCYDLFVNAAPSPLRDRWVAALTSGCVIGNGQGPSFEIKPQPTRPITDASHQFSAQVPAPQPFNKNAGQTFDVTPDIAVTWLERNTRNRALRGDVVTRYANDMRAGKWMVTGDAIAFDKHGAIVNGQHRLWAVFESGMTVRMLVVFDLEPEVVRVLDDHLKRKLTDIMHVARPGVNIQSKHAAAARTMMFNLTRTDRHSAASKLSRQEQIAFLEKHLPAIDFAVRDCFHSRNQRALTHTSVVAVVARASYTKSKERLIAFAKVYISGMPESSKDKAAIVFRNWLLRLDSQKVRASADVIYKKAERAVEAFLNGEELSTLYEASEELFPLPEEVAPKKVRS